MIVRYCSRKSGTLPIQYCQSQLNVFLRVPNNTTLRGHGARITLARKLKVINDQDMLVTDIAE